jgi:hypothetical protein
VLQIDFLLETPITRAETASKHITRAECPSTHSVGFGERVSCYDITRMCGAGLMSVPDVGSLERGTQQEELKQLDDSCRSSVTAMRGRVNETAFWNIVGVC